MEKRARDLTAEVVLTDKYIETVDLIKMQRYKYNFNEDMAKQAKEFIRGTEKFMTIEQFLDLLIYAMEE